MVTPTRVSCTVINWPVYMFQSYSRSQYTKNKLINRFGPTVVFLVAKLKFSPHRTVVVQRASFDIYLNLIFQIVSTYL